MENNESKFDMPEAVKEANENADEVAAISEPNLIDSNVDSEGKSDETLEGEESIPYKPAVTISPYREMSPEEINFNHKDYSFDVTNEKEFYIEPLVPLVIHTGIMLDSVDPICYRFLSNTECVNKDGLIVISNDIHKGGEIVLTMLWLGTDTGAGRFSSIKIKANKLNKVFKINFIRKKKYKVLKVPAGTVLAQAVTFISYNFGF